MTDRPILFSGAMVRALLAGAKTQTRRVCKKLMPFNPGCPALHGQPMAPCPYGEPGDHLWVRETMGQGYLSKGDVTTEYVQYMADGTRVTGKVWPFARRMCPSIHMPRAFSRITLEVTDVRVQRARDISEEDARAEGITPIPGSDGPNRFQVNLGDVVLNAPTAREVFPMLLDYVGRGQAWRDNAWVWAITFRRVT